MTGDTVVGIYDTPARAEAAVAELRSAGIPEGAITLHAQGAAASGTSAHVASATAGPERDRGFWAGLFGGEPDHDTAVYDRSLQRGSAVVTVRAAGAHVERVMAILERHDPVDVEERASEYELASTGATSPGPETLQLAEEQLQVGKRVVNRGGTRIRRYVVEMPVEREITLHREQVTLERRPVADGRLAGDSFTERTLELSETEEEPVISKQARVYEEIGLRKDVTDRVETVRDTVRKEEAEIEQIPAAAETTTVRR